MQRSVMPSLDVVLMLGLAVSVAAAKSNLPSTVAVGPLQKAVSAVPLVHVSHGHEFGTCGEHALVMPRISGSFSSSVSDSVVRYPWITVTRSPSVCAGGELGALPTGSPRQVALSAAYTGGISGFVFFLFAPARNFDDD